MPHLGPTEPPPAHRIPLWAAFILLAASVVVTVALSGIAELVVLGLIGTAYWQVGHRSLLRLRLAALLDDRRPYDR